MLEKHNSVIEEKLAKNELLLFQWLEKITDTCTEKNKKVF